MMKVPDDRVRSGMVLPVSKDTYFNTKKAPTAQLCPYDMLYHPPDYNPNSSRSDRQESKIIRKNIWNQEIHKPIPSTTHFQLGRPYWKILDIPTKQYVRAHVETANPHMRIYDVLNWAIIIVSGKQTICDDQ